jgi:phosphate transport system protein
MTSNLRHDIEQCTRSAFQLGDLVETAFGNAVQALQTGDSALTIQAQQIETDTDSREVVIESDCVRILALDQPVAIDLRMVVAVLKITSDLERMCDLAAKISKRAPLPIIQSGKELNSLLLSMALQVQQMLQLSLRSFARLDLSLAQIVLTSDNEIDAINRKIYLMAQEAIQAEPERTGDFLQLLTVSSCLERVADHATNIAEDTMYLVSGDIVRHRWSDEQPGNGQSR